jgi:hypothetical protein
MWCKCDVFNIVNITNEHNTTHKNVMFHTRTNHMVIISTPIDYHVGINWRNPKSQAKPKVASASRMRKFGDLRTRSQHSALKGVERRVEAPR